MNATTLVLRQVRWHNRAYWRNPGAAFFTFAFPVMFLAIMPNLFGSVFGDVALPTGQTVPTATFYTASIMSFSVITACYTYLGIGVTHLRDEGILKRIRGTPLPGIAYLLSKVLHSMAMMTLLVVIVTTFGVSIYGIGLPTTSVPSFIVTLLVGAATFSALGLAICAVTPNVEAAPALTNATLLPLLFISGVFIPTTNAPAWITTVADLFPVKHFTDAVIESFLPPPDNASGWRLGDLAVVSAWGVAAMIFAARRFRWEPSR